MPHWAESAGICIVALLLETVCSGKGPAETLRKLRQPAWALPFPAWVAIGLGYYGICFFALLRLLGRSVSAQSCIFLLMLLMFANAFGNYLLFRRKDYRSSFRYLIPYAGLAVGFLWCAWQVDQLVAISFGLYVLYLPYALAWTYRVWKLNDRELT